MINKIMKVGAVLLIAVLLVGIASADNYQSITQTGSGNTASQTVVGGDTQTISNVVTNGNGNTAVFVNINYGTGPVTQTITGYQTGNNNVVIAKNINYGSGAAVQTINVVQTGTGNKIVKINWPKSH